MQTASCLPHTVRLVGRDGAITITRGACGEVVLTLDGPCAEELLPRAAAELFDDAVEQLVIDVRATDAEAQRRCKRWLDGLQRTVLARHG